MPRPEFSRGIEEVLLLQGNKGLSVGRSLFTIVEMLVRFFLSETLEPQTSEFN